MFFGATTFAGGSFGAQGGASVTVTFTGIELTATLGAAVFLGDARVFPTGITITSNIGGVILPNVQVNPTGIPITSTLASVTAVPEHRVFPTGISVSTALGTPLVRAWAKIEPGVSNSWTPVSDTASFSWSAVNDSVSNTWTEVDDTEAA